MLSIIWHQDGDLRFQTKGGVCFRAGNAWRNHGGYFQPDRGSSWYSETTDLSGKAPAMKPTFYEDVTMEKPLIQRFSLLLAGKYECTAWNKNIACLRNAPIRVKALLLFEYVDAPPLFIFRKLQSQIPAPIWSSPRFVRIPPCIWDRVGCQTPMNFTSLFLRNFQSRLSVLCQWRFRMQVLHVFQNIMEKYWMRNSKRCKLEEN